MHTVVIFSQIYSVRPWLELQRNPLKSSALCVTPLGQAIFLSIGVELTLMECVYIYVSLLVSDFV